MTKVGPVDDGNTLDVRPNLDRDPFEDLATEHWRTGNLTHVGVLPAGTVEGNPAVVVVIDLADGTHVVGALPYTAAEVASRALAAVWGAT